MKIFQIIIILFIMSLIFLFEWPSLKKEAKFLKVVFVIIIVIGFSLSVMIILFPEMPNPTDFVQNFFRLFSTSCIVSF